MDKMQRTGIILIVLILATAIAVRALTPTSQIDEAKSKIDLRAYEAKIEARIAFLPWRTVAIKASWVLLLLSSSLAIVVFSALAGVSLVRKNSIVPQNIGEHSQINVHYSMISHPEFGFLMMGLVNAEQIRAANPKEALEASRGIMKAVTRLSSGRVEAPALVGMAENPLAFTAPPFRQILSGLSKGGQMVLGFGQGETPVKGAFDRIYSCGIFGLSRSGKTTGLYSIVCQSLLVFPDITYFVIDPHRKRPEGLTHGLPKTHNFTHLDPDNCKDGLYAFASHLNARLDSTGDYSQEPLVLLIDELPVLADKRDGSAAAALMGRIAKEGAKVHCYCLLAGQDTRLTGSVKDRSMLASKIAYNMESSQAGYLFRDKGAVELHKQVREAKEPGLCVLSTADDLPMIVKQPHCLPADVLYVEEQVRKVSGGGYVRSTPSISFSYPIEKNEHKEKVERMKRETGKSQNEIARSIGVTEVELSRLLNGRPLSVEKRQKIEEKLTNV